MNILVIAHAHPDFSIGGAEIAAYNLFKSVSEIRPDDSVTLLARAETKSVSPGAITQRRPREYLWRQDMGNWFYLMTAYPESIFLGFREFLIRQSPDLIFVHHYAHMGVEIFREIKKTVPNARLILTLHEYVAICNRNGQMLKASSNKLCYSESLDSCNRCFPDVSEENFWLRKNYIKRHFSYVDHFVSPSYFLRSRYIDWGIPAQNITMIENGQPDPPKLKLGQAATTRRVTFGFFGQVTEYKGLEILLKAFNQLPQHLRQSALCEVHGANLDHQGQWLKDLIAELREPLEKEGTLRWAGPYSRDEALRRISKVDWVVVPSTWWENSPMVIQEAFVCGNPVICSGIGGMAEKVRDGIDGVHFDVSNPFDLADKLAYILETPTFRAQLVNNIKSPPTYNEAALSYLALAE